MILTHESGAQEDQFDGKKRRPKISWYYPFKRQFIKYQVDVVKDVDDNIWSYFKINIIQDPRQVCLMYQQVTSNCQRESLNCQCAGPGLYLTLFGPASLEIVMSWHPVVFDLILFTLANAVNKHEK